MSNENFTEVKARQIKRQTKPSHVIVSDSMVEVDDNVNVNEVFESVAETSERPLSLRDRYGGFTVVSASFSLLLSFLASNLHWLSKQDKAKFGPIVDWAKTVLESGAIQSQRELIQGIIDSSAGKSASGTFACMKCSTRSNNNGEKYIYSMWFSGKNKVSAEITETNTMTLADARSNHLLDQICFRLGRLVERLDRVATCDFDYGAREELASSQMFFDGLYTQAEPHIAELAKLQETRNSQRATQFGNGTPYPNRSYQQAPAAPRKQATKVIPKGNLAPKKLEFEAEAPAAPKFIELPPSTRVSDDFTYADALAKNIKTAEPAKPVETAPIKKIKTAEPVKPVETALAKKTAEPAKLVVPVEMANAEPVNAEPVTEPSATASSSSKKAKKRAAQKKRKETDKNGTLANVSAEDPVKALELTPSPELPIDTETKPASEMVQVQMLTMIDGKPVMNTVVMSRADLANVQSATLAK